MKYGIMVNHKIVSFDNAKKAAAAFLYYKQENLEPKWLEYPGDYEQFDFYTIHDKTGKYLVLEGSEKVIMLDDDEDKANATAEALSFTADKIYYAIRGSITSDGFIAGPEDMEEWDPFEELDSLEDGFWDNWYEF